jgi:glycosyltransferase involved in cell wall biosynthesis
MSAGIVDVSVIVPVRTTHAHVREVCTALAAVLDRLGRRWEFIFVFDGVRGEAWRQAEELARLHGDRVQALHMQQSFGESTCLAAGFERARGAIIATSPQYVQIEPAEFGRMLVELDKGADFVAPWRKERVDPLFNRLQSALFNWVMRRIMQSTFHDLNCYLRVFRRQVLEDVAVYGDMYRFLPAIAQRQGFKVVELQVKHVAEWTGRSIYGLGVYARRLLDILGVVFLAKFTLKPLRFFGMVGGLLMLMGAALILALVAQNVLLEPGPIISRPVFLLGFLLLVLGVQVVGFGLVGEIIIYTQARNLREYKVERVHEGAPGDGGRAADA